MDLVSGPTAVVTGGAGFIGANLCRRLLDERQRVICVDNFFSSGRGNIADLLLSDNFYLSENDINIQFDVVCDHIYNLACPASPIVYQRDPIFTLRTAVIGALNSLELAQRTGARILQASTSEVYGNPLVHPQSESYWGNVNPTGIRACYDEGKRCAEALFADFRRTRGVDTRVVRIANTYGPGMLPNDGRVVSNLIVQALRGEDLTIYGSGLQTRSFCYVDDLVEALVKTMNLAEVAVGPINLGYPQECTILSLAQLVLDVTGSSSKLSFVALPEDDPTRRCPDISVAKQLLGWEPRTKLRDGIAATVEYFERVLSKPSWS